MKGSKTPSLALLLLALVAGCGTTDPGAGQHRRSRRHRRGDGGGSDSTNACQRPSGALLPWKVGNKWTYTVTETGVVATKITTIEALEAVGGTGPNATKMANKVVTKKGVMDQTISWQALIGEKVVRYREQSYGATSGMLELEEHWDPYKLHIDGSAEHMVPTPDAWFETYKETKLRVGGQPVTATAMDAWQVASECEVVEVLGTKYNALKVTKFGGDLKTYWYVPGIGKVKETGGQTEELVKFEAAP